MCRSAWSVRRPQFRIIEANKHVTPRAVQILRERKAVFPESSHPGCSWVDETAFRRYRKEKGGNREPEALRLDEQQPQATHGRRFRRYHARQCRAWSGGKCTINKLTLGPKKDPTGGEPGRVAIVEPKGFRGGLDISPDPLTRPLNEKQELRT